MSHFFYTIKLRTRTKNSIVEMKTATTEEGMQNIVTAFTTDMHNWERNTNLFKNDPLEVVVESERIY